MNNSRRLYRDILDKTETDCMLFAASLVRLLYGTNLALVAAHWQRSHCRRSDFCRWPAPHTTCGALRRSEDFLRSRIRIFRIRTPALFVVLHRASNQSGAEYKLFNTFAGLDIAEAVPQSWLERATLRKTALFLQHRALVA